jgi:hypothetical protein
VQVECERNLHAIGVCGIFNGMKPTGHYEDIPDRKRYKDLAIVAVLFAMPASLFFSMGVESSGEAALTAWSAAGVATLCGCLIGFLIYRKKQIFVPDPPAPIVLSEEEIKAQAEAKAKWDRIERQWWYRYPMAGLMLLSAWFVVEMKPNFWWVAVVLVIYGLILAKELGYLVLVGLVFLVGLWFFQGVFQGIASLPISVAVIIGALIIAAAANK